MALTSAQMADTRRFLGYQLAGTTMATTADQDTVYMRFGMLTMSLYKRLTTLSADEENVLINVYLDNLTALESAIVTAGDNLDTDQAAVWFRNKNEVGDRMALLNLWRRRLCGFLGCPPGPDLASGLSVARS